MSAEEKNTGQEKLSITWSWKPPKAPLSGSLVLVWPIVLRSFSWNILLTALIFFTLRLIAPEISINPQPFITGPLLVLFCFLLCALSVEIDQRSLRKYLLNDKGVFIKKSRAHLKWKGAVGYSINGQGKDAILLVGKGGQPFSLPLPSEPLRTDVLSFIESRTPPLTAEQVDAYSTPIVFTVMEVLGFTVLSYFTALIVAYFSPTIFKMANNVYIFMGISLLPCLAANGIVLQYFSRRFPQFPYLRLPLLLSTTFFSGFMAFLFSTAFLTKMVWG